MCSSAPTPRDNRDPNGDARRRGSPLCLARSAAEVEASSPARLVAARKAFQDERTDRERCIPRRLRDRRGFGHLLRHVAQSVADLSVLAEVESLALLLRADPQADREVGHLEESERHQERVGHRDEGQHGLRPTCSRLTDAPAALMARLARAPVRTTPTIPPTMWTPTTYSESS